MIFYLGTHRPVWLTRTDVPLLLSRRSLAAYRTLPRALGRWALDSGAFTELKDHGEWTVSPADYAADVRRFEAEVGNLAWAAPQDWMCEPFILEKTRLGVAAHQRLTLENYRELRQLAPDQPWVPVLQGWTEADYLRHADQYDTFACDLEQQPLVGLGSVCRRQNTAMVESLIRRLERRGIRLHPFGFKLGGLARVAGKLASSDSLAWSRAARWEDPLPGCSHAHCTNCMTYALWWRGKVLRVVEKAERVDQPLLLDSTAAAGA